MLADYVAVLGDTFTIEGIRIKVVGTGDYKTIEISKVGQADAEKYALLYPPPP